MATLVSETVDTKLVTQNTNHKDHLSDAQHDGSTTEQQHQDEELSTDLISLEVALKTCCFEGFEGKQMTFLYTTQLTCSNVMSTVVTARPIDTSIKRKTKQSSFVSNNQQESSTGSGAAMHVYAQSTNPKKVKKKNGKYQAQLPAFHRSLPALPIPINRLNHELLQERNKFMQQLQREREEKKQLDNWAATKIQACYRGYRARPRVTSYEIRQRINTMSSLRLDLSDMEKTRKQQPTVVDTRDSSASPWRQEIQSRAIQKREFRVSKERKQSAATQVQAIVRGYVARCAFVRLYARHIDEIFHAAIVRIQSMFRAFRLRTRIASVVARLQQQAAIQIQSLIRGIHARERVLTLTFERKCEARRRAGQPLQFTLPQRTHEIVHTSSLRVLVIDRKTAQQLAFKSATWYEERQLLHIYKVATKLNVQREWLLRWTAMTSTTKKRKKRAVRQSSRLSTRLSTASNPSTINLLTPTTPTNGRRRPVVSGPSSPTSSRPSSPANARSIVS